MKIISLVPSWTETLLAAQVQIVGRTRFCIHPKNLVRTIPQVGGTKSADWKKVAELSPDFIIMDKEENTKEMFENSPFPVHTTHVRSIQDLPQELSALADFLKNSELESMANEWTKLLKASGAVMDILKLPGVIKWLKKPQYPIKNVLYIIWRDPWMAVNKETFIGSMLDYLGINCQIPNFDSKYPKINLDNFEPSSTLLLFSSEPYPFAKKVRELKDLPFPSALVDGEEFGWFGVRSFQFLSKHLKSFPR